MSSLAPIRRLRDVPLADAVEVGGKAASLGELLAAGVRVPDGVVLTAAVADMPVEDRRPLVRAGLQDLGDGPFAVRSSGIAEDGSERSFAGIYETVLDVSANELPAAREGPRERGVGPRRRVRAGRRRPHGGDRPADGQPHVSRGGPHG